VYTDGNQRSSKSIGRNKMFKIIILDFDGVIVESVGIKTKAFSELFIDEYPQHVDEFVQFHLENNGMSRYAKIGYFYRHFLGREALKKEKQYWAERFSKLVVDKVVSCPPVTGSLEFLEELHNKIPLYVASVVPQAELQEIIKRRGLYKYFTGVYGTIKKKSGILYDIIRDAKVNPGECFFIGDTKEDCEAAKETGIFMLGRKNVDDLNRFNISLCRDLYEAKEWIAERNLLFNFGSNTARKE
jgi:beta-phosphoglucomutase-like phosphatase (HAD superfamily)